MYLGKGNMDVDQYNITIVIRFIRVHYSKKFFLQNDFQLFKLKIRQAHEHACINLFTSLESRRTTTIK